MLYDDLAQREAKMIELVRRAFAALAALRGEQPLEGADPAPDEHMQQLKALYEALVRLGVAGSWLYEELTNLLAAEPIGMIESWKEEPGLMTVRQAGRKGGRLVREKYGPSHYSAMGKQGGAAVRDQFGTAYYMQIGKKGGQALREQLGLAHFGEIGKRGGKKLAEQRGADYYRTIGQKGGKAPRKKREGENPPS